MLIPRRTQLAEAASQAQGPLNFHLWSTVAPSAHLGDTRFKVWMQQLLKRLGLSYAVQIQGFAISEGQFHVVLQWTPGAAAQWNDEEVRTRWLAAHPPRHRGHRPRQPMTEEGIAPDMAPRVDAAAARQKLGNLSQFMKLFKQLVTQKINRLTHRKGTLWRGRFKLAHLKDASAVAGAMAFVDLRQVVETGGDRPEAAPFTSLHVRVGQYQAMYGMSGADLPAQGEAVVFGPEVAQALREGPDPWERDGPPSQAGEESLMGVARAEPRAPMPPVGMGGGMPPMMMPGMEPVTMPGMDGMNADMGMMGGTPMPGAMPEAMPEATTMPEMPAVTAPAGGSWPGEPDPPLGAAPQSFWLSALREDGPRALLATIPLRRYLNLLDALVDKAKAWPHLPATAPGRAPAPATPPWEGALTAALLALGLSAAAFEAQWKRLATLRM